MLELTGTLKGKVYNQELVSPEQFAALVGAPGKKGPGEDHTLEICPNLVKQTPEGQLNYPRGITQQNQTALSIDGDNINVRYFKQKNPMPGNPGQFNYSPSHISFGGLKNSYTAANYEEFLFLYVSPLCKNSPSASMDPMFQYHDPSAIEKAAIVKSEKLEKMLGIIQSAPSVEVIAKSRGMVVAGQSTNVPQGAGVGLHRAALIELLVRHQDEFAREWVNDSVLVRGLAREAMQKGSVKQQQVGTRQAWVWSSDNRVITFIPEGADPFTELVSWSVNAENTEFAKSAFTLAVTGQPQREQELHPNTPPKSQGRASETRGMLELAAEKGLVWREEDTNRVMYQGQQGPVETRVCSAEDWIADLEKFLKIPGKQNHWTAIKAALNNQ